MSSSAGVVSVRGVEGPIAPWWHTALLLALKAANSVAGVYQHGLPHVNLPGVSLRISSYVTVTAQEWLGVLLIWLALKSRGLSLGSLVSGRWRNAGAFFKDLGIALGVIVAAIVLTGGLIKLYVILGGTSPEATLAKITPKTGIELVVWLVLAASGGFCEEVVYRGYFAQQFSAWTGSRAFGLILQGIIFGLAHGFYGLAMVAVMAHGWLLGLVAYWRKSLRPGILAHVLQDVLGGVASVFS